MRYCIILPLTHRLDRIDPKQAGTLVSCTIKALVSCTSCVRYNSGSWLGWRFPVSVTAHVFVYIKLLSTGACANITIREIMLINIISSASWTLQVRCLPLSSLSAPAADPSPGTLRASLSGTFLEGCRKPVLGVFCLFLEFAPGTVLTLQRG